MFGNDISFFYVFLGVYLCASSSTAELVSIGPERTFSRYATVESKQTRIFWNPAVEGLPQSAVDFQNAYSEGLWTTSLDGIGDRREQVLAVYILLILTIVQTLYDSGDGGHSCLR